jgi:hypothetical protein
MLRLYDLDSNEKCILRNEGKYIQGEASNIIFNFEISGLKELGFVLPLYYIHDGIKTENERWSYMHSEMLVRYDNGTVIDWFKIKSMEDVRSNGKLTSNVQCKHISYDLSKKGFDKDFSSDINQDICSAPTQIMTAILEDTGWTLGTVDATLNTKIRTFNMGSQSNTLEMLNKVAELFEGYLRFNGDAKTVDLLLDVGDANGQASFRYKKNLKSISRVSNTENLVTRLYAYGGEDEYGTIGISEINTVNKQPFVQNFDYFVDAGLLSLSATPIYVQYNADMLDVNNRILALSILIQNEEANIIDEQSLLETKNLEKAAVNSLIDEIDGKLKTFVPGSDDYVDLQAERVLYVAQLDVILTQIVNLTATVAEYQGIVDDYNEDLDVLLVEKEGYETQFKSDYADYLFDGKWQDSSYTDAQVGLESLEVGDAYGGGIVAYIYQPEDSEYIEGKTGGIISSVSDQSAGIFWHSGRDYIRVTDTDIGSGNNNTKKIIATYGEENNAARKFYNLVLNGYLDWHLPSYDELNKLYLAKSAIGGFSASAYWSSSEDAAYPGKAWSQNFSTGARTLAYKEKTYKVRGIRNFSVDTSSLTAHTELYDDAVTLLEKSCYPTLTYSMSIADLSKLTGMSLDSFELGDRVFVYDELLKINTSLKITKIQKNIDKPADTQVEISTVNSVFQDLFKSIAKSSTTLSNSKDTWDRTKTAIDAGGNINSTSLQNTVTDNGLNIPIGTGNSGTVGANGISFENPLHSPLLTKLDGGNIQVSVDSGVTWKPLFLLYNDDGTNRIGIDLGLYARGGSLDVSQVSIYGGSDNTNFYWNKYGLNAADPLDPLNKYIIFNKDGLMATKDNGVTSTFNLQSNGDFSMIGTLQVGSYLGATPITSINSDIYELVDFFNNTYPGDIQDIYDQLDGVVDTYFMSGTPTLSNPPADEWISDSLKNEHRGDIYYNIDTGLAYRFISDDAATPTFSWLQIADTDFGLALEAASNAQETADGKMRVFVAEPYTPYAVGDLWCGDDSSELMRCNFTRLTGAYNASDWELATKYDNTVTTINDGIITTGTIQLSDGIDTKAGMTGATEGDDSTRIWAGATYDTRNTAPFRVTQGGDIIATSGFIGGWQLYPFSMYYDADTGASSSGMASLDYPFYAGSSYANRYTAPFRVYKDGSVTAESISITGDSTLDLLGSAIIGESLSFRFEDEPEEFWATFVKIPVENGGGFGIWSPLGLSLGTREAAIEFGETGSVGIDCNELGFFVKTPIAQQSLTILGSKTTTETADATYSSNEVNMLNHLKKDMQTLYTKVNGIMNKLIDYGLFYEL